MFRSIRLLRFDKGLKSWTKLEPILKDSKLIRFDNGLISIILLSPIASSVSFIRFDNELMSLILLLHILSHSRLLRYTNEAISVIWLCVKSICFKFVAYSIPDISVISRSSASKSIRAFMSSNVIYSDGIFMASRITFSKLRSLNRTVETKIFSSRKEESVLTWLEIISFTEYTPVSS